MAGFRHKALNLKKEKLLVYTALSKHYFYFRHHISKFILAKGGVPINPFMLFDYFLLDSVDKDSIRESNNTLVKRCDELWVFGPVSDGVLAEINIAKPLGKKIKYFKIVESKTIVSIPKNRVGLEQEVQKFRKLL